MLPLMRALLPIAILSFLGVAMASAAGCSVSIGTAYTFPGSLGLPATCDGDFYIAETGDACGCTGTYYAVCDGTSFADCDCSIPSGYTLYGGGSAGAGGDGSTGSGGAGSTGSGGDGSTGSGGDGSSGSGGGDGGGSGGSGGG